jgi:hypothetical protein
MPAPIRSGELGEVVVFVGGLGAVALVVALISVVSVVADLLAPVVGGLVGVSGRWGAAIAR